MQSISQKLTTLSVFACLSWSVFSGVAAQSTLNPESKANMMFDLNVKSLRECEIVRAIGFKTLVSELNLSERATGMNPNHIDRVLALFRFPDDVNEVIQMGPGRPFPIDFLWLLETSEPLTEIAEELESETFELEKNGITYRCLEDTPGVYFYFSDKQTYVCTEAYLSTPPEQLMTEGLSKVLNSIQAEYMFRAGVDVESSRTFIEGMLELDRTELPFPLPEPSLINLLKPHQNIDRIALSANLNERVFVNGLSQSKDEGTAKAFESDLSQLLGMARIGGLMAMGEIGVSDKKDVAAFQDILKQLRPERIGKTNRLTLEKLDDFDALASTLIREAKIKAAEAAKLNRFREVALAVHNFHDAYGKLPFGDIDNGKFHKDLSWRTRICPFLENRFAFDYSEPWDSETNKVYANQMPETFGGDGENSDIVWMRSEVTNFSGVTDGTSNTIMLIEKPDGIPWTQTGDMTVLQAVKLFRSLKDGEDLTVAFYDGSVHRIEGGTRKHNEFKALLTPAGGEVID